MITVAARSKLHAGEISSEYWIPRLAARKKKACMVNRFYQQELKRKQHLHKDSDIYGESEDDIMYYENIEIERSAVS